MLEGQEIATTFFRPFEEPWHKLLVEWLRLEKYAEGMPSDMRQSFEQQLQEESRQWENELLQAEKIVRLSLSIPLTFFHLQLHPTTNIQNREKF